IPIFSEFISQNRRQEADRFSSSIISYGILVDLAISLIIIVFARQLSQIVAPGFSESETLLMANLMVVIQLSQVFFVVGTVFSGILQSHQHFLIPGIASALYNFGIILGIVIFTVFLGWGIYGTTLGVLIGAFFFFI